MADETTPAPKALIEALVKAQGEMEVATKDSKNPHFNTRYADLAAVMAAVRQPLARNGLAVVQLFAPAKEGFVAIETRLMHVSGEMLSSVLELPVAQRSPQGIGSAITYARRYGLAALLTVVADEDDDGNAASAPVTKPPPPPKPKAAPKSAEAASTPAPSPAPAQATETPKPPEEPPELADVDRIRAATTSQEMKDIALGRSKFWSESTRAEWRTKNDALVKEGK